MEKSRPGKGFQAAEPSAAGVFLVAVLVVLGLADESEDLVEDESEDVDDAESGDELPDSLDDPESLPEPEREPDCVPDREP